MDRWYLSSYQHCFSSTIANRVHTWSFVPLYTLRQCPCSSGNFMLMNCCVHWWMYDINTIYVYNVCMMWSYFLTVHIYLYICIYIWFRTEKGNDSQGIRPPRIILVIPTSFARRILHHHLITCSLTIVSLRRANVQKHFLVCSVRAELYGSRRRSRPAEFVMDSSTLNGSHRPDGEFAQWMYDEWHNDDVQWCPWKPSI